MTHTPDAYKHDLLTRTRDAAVHRRWRMRGLAGGLLAIGEDVFVIKAGAMPARAAVPRRVPSC
jgi:hypothetical protein